MFNALWFLGAKEKHGGRSRGPWAERGAEDSARGNGGANQLCLEELGDEIGGGHRAPAQEVEDSLFAEAADGAAGL